MVLVGYGEYLCGSSTKPGFKVRNSWGSSWGKKGHCYMTGEQILQLQDVIMLTPPEVDGEDIEVRRTLRKGMKGDDVSLLQEILNALGFECGAVDGSFGSKTLNAVQGYQISRGLKIDGVVGKMTWTALDLEDIEPEEEPPEPEGLKQLFIDYLKEQVRNHSIYVWGAQGQTGSAITKAWIKRRETTSGNAERAYNFWQKQVAAGYGNVLRAFDCSGLILYFIQNLYGLVDHDTTANGLYTALTDPISRTELRDGDLVFRVADGRAYHVGVVVNGGTHVIHAKGRDYGVVEEGISENGTTYWNRFGRFNIM